jgi:8-oxo-dGTP pyrophosphatase MutT (NUDIX family)
MGEEKKKKTSSRSLTTKRKIIKSDSIVREFSAGGVVYKKIGNETAWLVTKTAPSELYPDPVWILPKGWLDDVDTLPGPYTLGLKKANEEFLQKSAIREVEEEGGIKAKIVSKITTDRYFFTKKDGERVLKFEVLFNGMAGRFN